MAIATPATIKSQVIQALGDLLSTGDEADRCYASRALGVLADNQATAWLIDHLRDDDIDVCVDAAEALGQIGDSAAVPSLLESLTHDPDGEVKTAMVNALGQLGGAEVIPRLIEIAEKRPEDMAFDDTDDWDMWWDMQLKAVISLGELRATKAIPILQKILDDDELQDIESEVLSALAMIGGDGNEFLLERLQEGSLRQRRRVAHALGKSRDHDTLAPLGRALRDSGADVREAVVTSLAQRDAVRYLPAILMLFRDSSAEVRNAAARAAIKLSASSAQSDLQPKDFTHILEDPDSRVRKTVLEILTNLPAALDDVTQTRIIASLQDNDADIVAAAGNLLTKKGRADTGIQLLIILANSDKSAEIHCRILESLGELAEWNGDIETALIQAIISGENTVRLAALDALASLDHAFAATPTTLEKIANNHKPATLWPIEIITAAVAGQLIKPSTHEKIIPIIPAEQVQAANDDALVDTVEAESKPIPQSTLDAIIQANEDATATPAKTDESASNDTPEEDAETLAFKQLLKKNQARTERMLSRESDNIEVGVDVRRQAARILGKTHSKMAIQALGIALEDNDSVLQIEAAKSLGQISHKQTEYPALEKILESLRSQLESADQNLRVATVQSLCAIGHPDDLQILLDLLEDDELFMRIEIVRALTDRLKTTATEPELSTVCNRFVSLLKDNESGVRRAAIQGLSALLDKLDTKANQMIRENTVAGAIDAGFMGADGQTSDMARGLKAIAPELGTEKLLTRLAELPNSLERRFAIEMLTEIHRPKAA
jgi:HEAT repeat protein